MKANRLLGAILAAGLGLVVVGGGGSEAMAKPKAGATVGAAPETKKPITIVPSALSWGMSPKQVAEVYDKMIDADYESTYEHTSPGVKMRALDAQVAEEKSQFRRSRIDFGKLPTTIDSTFLKPEYTYNNKESMLTSVHKDQTRHFFFIQDKLWKIIDEISYDDGKTFGKNFQEVVVKVSTAFGVPGRVIDPSKGQHDATAPAPLSTEVDWHDANTRVRIIERTDSGFARAYSDRTTEGNIGSMRPNKPVDDSGIDPAVAAIMRKGGDDPGPPDPKKHK